MKPNFALSLSFDGLRLMHRVQDGWHLVGEVALDDPDMTGALTRLRDSAAELDQGAMATKLLIPNDQIKYLALDTTRASEDDVRDALNGATPYAVDDLTYDFAKGGGRTYVAAVANETLQEARQFASEYGFNPVCFAAIPEPFTFVGEAFFGAVDGETVERDSEPVVVVGTAILDIAEADGMADGGTDVEPDVLAADDLTSDDLASNDLASDDLAADAPEDPADAPLFSPDPQEDPDDTPEEVAEAAADNDSPRYDAEAQPEVDTVGEPESAPEAEPELEEPAPLFASLRADRSDRAPGARAARDEPKLRREPGVDLAVPKDDGAGAPRPLFGASRTQDDGRTPPEAGFAASPLTTDTPEVEAAPAITGKAPTALPPEAAVAAASLTIEPEDPIEEEAPAEGGKTTAFGAVGGAVGGIFASRRMARASAADNTRGGSEQDAAKRTVFGARKPTAAKATVGGKPRFLGLILTAILLVFLLAIAAFAAISPDGLARWFGFGGSDTQIASEPTPVAEPAPQVAETAPVAPVEQPAEPEIEVVDTLAAPTPPMGGQVLTPEEAQRIYAATGVWQRAPRIPTTPRTSTTEGLQTFTAPNPVTRVPSSPLAPGVEMASDSLFPTPIDPPPPSQTFEFGEDGLIVATEDGAVTPDGILVIAGSPALNPPTRPGTIAPEITPQDLLADLIPETAEPVVDAVEGVIVIEGAPALRPPIRTGTAPPAPQPDAQALAAGAEPLVVDEGLLVIAGQPPVLPPARPGTTATPVAVTPEATVETPQTEPEILAQPDAPVDPVAAVPPQDTLASDAPTAPDAAAPNPTVPDTIEEGLNVIAGPPPVLPPARPGTRAPEQDASLEGLSEDIAVALSTSTAQAPDANTPRPLVRPAAIAQAAQAAANRPVLGALTLAQAAAFRPTLRPAGLVPEPAPEPEPAAVAEASPAPATTGLQIAPEIAAAVEAAASRPNPFVNATAAAVPISSRPDPRPRNMDRIVARAAAAQERAATQTAAVAPRTIAPSGPTAGAVSRNATLENAINLREINLMGIYGSSGDRRALVRLPNGRFERVTVGDRLDGGRVTAITSAQLSYMKRGRQIILQVGG